MPWQWRRVGRAGTQELDKGGEAAGRRCGGHEAMGWLPNSAEETGGRSKEPKRAGGRPGAGRPAGAKGGGRAGQGGRRSGWPKMAWNVVYIEATRFYPSCRGSRRTGSEARPGEAALRERRLLPWRPCPAGDRSRPPVVSGVTAQKAHKKALSKENSRQVNEKPEPNV